VLGSWRRSSADPPPSMAASSAIAIATPYRERLRNGCIGTGLSASPVGSRLPSAQSGSEPGMGHWPPFEICRVRRGAPRFRGNAVLPPNRVGDRRSKVTLEPAGGEQRVACPRYRSDLPFAPRGYSRRRRFAWLRMSDWGSEIGGARPDVAGSGCKRPRSGRWRRRRGGRSRRGSRPFNRAWR